ncbi:MAG: hypothetical protein FWF45_02885 [Coriobacteriia bacterium]|nr:hypothetical protein [Coriobacteriia bacterium]
MIRNVTPAAIVAATSALTTIAIRTMSHTFGPEAGFFAAFWTGGTGPAGGTMSGITTGEGEGAIGVIIEADRGSTGATGIGSGAGATGSDGANSGSGSGAGVIGIATGRGCSTESSGRVVSMDYFLPRTTKRVTRYT